MLLSLQADTDFTEICEAAGRACFSSRAFALANSAYPPTCYPPTCYALPKTARPAAPAACFSERASCCVLPVYSSVKDDTPLDKVQRYICNRAAGVCKKKPPPLKKRSACAMWPCVPRYHLAVLGFECPSIFLNALSANVEMHRGPGVVGCIGCP
jgi:hypothetical protein